MTDGMEIVRIHRNVKDAGALLHPVCQRIKTMAERYGPDADTVVTLVMSSYATRDPRVAVWAFVRDGELVGHLMAKVREWDTEHLAWIHQLEYDGTSTQAQWDAAFAEFSSWVTEVNAAYKAAGQPVVIRRTVASTPHNPKFFERRAGFRVWRTLLIKEDG